jgi:hypothetical protein
MPALRLGMLCQLDYGAHNSGENKVRENLLTLVDTVSWFQSKQRTLGDLSVSLVDIQQREMGPKPGAFADFYGVHATGRITGWVSGEFDFEALGSDGKEILCRHVDVVALDQLEEAFASFIQALTRA